MSRPALILALAAGFIKSPLNTPPLCGGDESGVGFNKPSTYFDHDIFSQKRRVFTNVFLVRLPYQNMCGVNNRNPGAVIPHRSAVRLFISMPALSQSRNQDDVLRALVNSSEAIVIGEINGLIFPTSENSAPGAAWVKVLFGVREVLKGRAGSSLTVRFDSVRQDPNLLVGRLRFPVILFLGRRDSDGSFRISSPNQVQAMSQLERVRALLRRRR